ncbi:hypothetical protein PhaeoP88_01764 [Phaeobacter inhibens]|uniref:Transposase n=1 Tax=Phaeobacter inhibens TaxID=221822 RepID=A0A2I7K984_9RHOB|nr:hypothetical protein PhaeoP88_01764 [Phaeobacter inhibens]
MVSADTMKARWTCRAQIEKYTFRLQTYVFR